MIRKTEPSTELLQEMLENVDTDKVRSAKEWDLLIANLMDFQDEMTEWEYNFMNSMVDVAEKNGTPSKKQRAVLKKLEEKYLQEQER